MRVGQQREVGGLTRVALAGLGLAVVDPHPPLAAAVAAEVELNRRLGGSGLLGD